MSNIFKKTFALSGLLDGLSRVPWACAHGYETIVPTGQENLDDFQYLVLSSCGKDNFRGENFSGACAHGYETIVPLGQEAYHRNFKCFERDT